jgi:uncharacterized protein YukE
MLNEGECKEVCMTDEMQNRTEQTEGQPEENVTERVQREVEARMAEVLNKASAVLAQRAKAPKKLIVDAGQLEKVAERFGDYAHTFAEITAEIERALAEIPHERAAELEWLRVELTELILPNLRYMGSGFATWRTQVNQIAQNYQNVSRAVDRQQANLAELEALQRNIDLKKYEADIDALDAAAQAVRDSMPETSDPLADPEATNDDDSAQS